MQQPSGGDSDLFHCARNSPEASRTKSISRLLLLHVHTTLVCLCVFACRLVWQRTPSARALLRSTPEGAFSSNLFTATPSPSLHQTSRKIWGGNMGLQIGFFCIINAIVSVRCCFFSLMLISSPQCALWLIAFSSGVDIWKIYIK